MVRGFDVDTQDLMLAALIDEGHAQFDKNDDQFVDICLVCRGREGSQFITPSRDWTSNDWSYQDTFASKKFVEHMVAKHDDILTLISMKILALK